MKPRPRALLMDDEPDILELLELSLAPMAVDCCKAANLHEARQRLQEQEFALCLTDMRLPDGDGIELVKLAARHYPGMPVAVITVYGSMESAVEALKSGAFNFISKPVALPVLHNLVTTALEVPITYPHWERRTRYRLLGESPPSGPYAPALQNWPAAKRRCTLAGNRARARSWSPGSFMSGGPGPKGLSCR